MAVIYHTYLAGPMENVLYAGKNWRKTLDCFLKKYGVKVYNPVEIEKNTTGLSVTKTKKLLKKLRVLTIQGDKDAESKFEKVMTKIMRTDFKFVEKSNFIIAKIIENVVAGGTTSEIIHAAFKKIPVYVIYEGNPEKLSSWVLFWVLCSNGRVFLEKKKNDFSELLNFLKNKFELRKLEQDSYEKKDKKQSKKKEK